MNKQNLIIYDFTELFSILNEIKQILNFNLLNVSEKEFDNLKLDNLNNFLIITKNRNLNIKNQILLNDFPLKISKIIETINVNFLKNRFIQQSDIDLGVYKLNLNSRKIFNNKNELSLTEKESDIILFLKNSEKPVSIDELQTPLGQRARGWPRMLGQIRQKHKEWLKAGGKMADAKRFQNCIRQPMFDIPTNQVCIWIHIGPII